jgi:DnaJ-class molecular chaperone
MKFEDLDKARRILKLDSEVKIKEIKDSFRKLVKETHPDTAKERNKEDSIKRFREISWAYEIIMNYLSNYKFSFKEDDFNEQHIDFEKELKDHMDRFFDDWL